MRTEKERQIEELASALEVPILFQSDIEKGKKDLVLKWTNGKWYVYTIKVIPTLINDNETLTLDYHLYNSIQSAGQRGT